MPFDIDLNKCMLSLRKKRGTFHSEADFQFALAWEIQILYPEAEIRLEYCPKEFPNMHIDIFVIADGKAVPIELKYKTARCELTLADEMYRLKNHGAQDLGKYDCLYDLQRIERLSSALPNYVGGFVVWLTNDPSYWNPSKKLNAVCNAFSIHNGSIKTGNMRWSDTAGAGTTKGRESAIILSGSYTIYWSAYSLFQNCKNGDFRYAIQHVPKQ